MNKDIKGAPPRRFRGLALKSPPPGIDRDYMKVHSRVRFLCQPGIQNQLTAELQRLCVYCSGAYLNGNGNAPRRPQVSLLNERPA